MNTQMFKTPAMAHSFSIFGQWLLEKVGQHKAAITINRYALLFTEIEAQQTDTSLLGFDTTVLPNGTRRNFRLIISWMTEVLNIIPDQRSYQKDSETQRINTLIKSFSSTSPAAIAINHYWANLNQKQEKQKTTLRSIRLALSPAVSLLKSVDNAGKALPAQTSLEKFIGQAPGQMAAITGFVNFLNANYNTKLSMTIAAKQIKRLRKKKLKTELVTMIRSAQTGILIEKEWVASALEYFHGLPAVTCRSIRDLNIKRNNENGGMDILLNNKTYWIPTPKMQTHT